MSTTLLSLDTSSTITGYAIFKDGKYQTSGVIDYNHWKNTEERLQFMLLNIIKQIEKYNPDIIVIEKDVVGSGKRQNMSTINTLIKIIGGVWGYCVDVNKNYPLKEPKIFYYEYSPSEWRKAVGLKGKNRDEYKHASIQKIKDDYGIEVDDNEADAINIGLAYIKQWS